ncbi:cytochrome P450 [Striga asiatica]|uniref:Cytochrome P450 n=1 Tax=Striga asiatica TaxID=4170 RepID=A0A5A7P6L3_STRAF|nr:cytochrome P450 [Striga asiatica]
MVSFMVVGQNPFSPNFCHDIRASYLGLCDDVPIVYPPRTRLWEPVCSRAWGTQPSWVWAFERLTTSSWRPPPAALLTSKLLRGRRLNLPPDPTPLPIFSSWLKIGNKLDHLTLARLAKTYGDLLLVRMGQLNIVAVSSRHLAARVLLSQGSQLGSPSRNIVFDVFTGRGQDMIFTEYGDQWRRMRRIVVVSFFMGEPPEVGGGGGGRGGGREAGPGGRRRRGGAQAAAAAHGVQQHLQDDVREEDVPGGDEPEVGIVQGEFSRPKKERRKDAKLDGYDIPAGSRVLVNAWKLANDPDLWNGPDEFRPERFLEEESGVEAHGNDLKYIPFGVGWRSCPGIVIAMPVLGITLGRLVQNFEMFPPPGESRIDTAENNGKFAMRILKPRAV